LVVELRQYRRADGVVPFDRWMARLRDARAKARILVQLDRLRVGLPGDWKAVGAGVFEIRIHEGKGYRVYFARDGATVVILLCAGDKSTQRRDIEQAKSYWREYRRQA
jgi:putative addiction module killer protein